VAAGPVRAQGDGITYSVPAGAERTGEQVLKGFSTAFPWLGVSQATTGDANLELAEPELPLFLRMPCSGLGRVRR